ncbi:hypothetical protein SCUCBS95973_000738 [Sporothrix curviconia]|uniref:Cytochrome P450 n=1 Tax=Sporothrix curviconia TaxID=1260050 RepID=A0ABP0ASU6_9PEZI
MHTVLLLLVGIVIVGAVSSMHRLWTQTLAGIPGPRLAAISRTWYAYQVRNGRILQLATTLHQRYGPAVRVAPNEVWFNSPEAFRAIYISTVLFHPVTDWRRPFDLAFPDTLDLLSERDMKRYRKQRRLIGPAYHETNMAKFGPAIDAVLIRAVAELRSLGGARIDLKEWMHIIAVECLGAVVLSWSPGLLKAHSDAGSSSAGYYNWRRKSVFGLFPALVVADFHSGGGGPVLRAFTALWRLAYDSDPGAKSFFPAVSQRIAARVRKALKACKVEREQYERAGEKGTAARASQDLLGDLVALHRSRPEFTETYLRRMAMTNFGAGHETMCSALTAAVAMIGSHPDTLRKVAAEVRQVDSKGRPKYHVTSARDAAAKMPFTAASIKEAQRLHPAIGMSLSRVVPPPACPGDPPLALHGHVLPPGTIVGCSPPALHRNPAIFGHDADEYKPGRWLDGGGGRNAADVADADAGADSKEYDTDGALRRRLMERINLTWGGGARTCPGRYLAELVVYKTVVALVRNFDVEAAMPADQDIKYYFLAMLEGATARFHARGGKEGESTGL